MLRLRNSNGPQLKLTDATRSVVALRHACERQSHKEIDLSDLGEFVEDQMPYVAATPEEQRALKQIASGRCAKFDRGFGGLEAARRLPQDNPGHWFLDLLRLWRPAGEPSGDYGLRLAVRDGYLNFYRQGQSIAKVSIVRGQLRGEVHV